jgi:hypothetical protein
MRRRRVVVGLVGLALAAGVAVGGYRVWHPSKPQPPRDQFGFRYDPVEDDPALRPMFAEADREAKRQLEERRAKQGRPGKSALGDGRFYAGVKKQFLKDKYGIDWRTPAEMNPDKAFD